MHRRRALSTGIAAALLVVSLAACSSGSPDGGETAQDPDSTGTDAPNPLPTEAPDAGGLSAVSDGTADELTCGEPPVDVLDWAEISVASHPGPVTAAAVVYAATTATGDWYVLAVDRLFETDDGTTVEGEGTRSLGLTNTVNPPPGEPLMVDLGHGAIGETVTPEWGSVTWTGDTLDAGDRAAARAQECLEEMTAP